jgi:hypothetical protein
MAVNRQDYTVSAPWLNFNLADVFRNAFIDAGLMTEWFDSFTTGAGPAGSFMEHRILRIVQVPGVKYGTVFHWFVFRPNGFTAYAYTHTWDPVNHVPTGDSRIDFLFTSYVDIEENAFQYTHRRFGTNILSTTTTLTRYTSTVDSRFSMFLLKGGSNFFTFFFQPANSQPQSFVDLNRNTCGGLIVPTFRVTNPSGRSQNVSIISFRHLFHLRNSIFAYGYLTSETFAERRNYANGAAVGCAYAAMSAGGDSEGQSPGTTQIFTSSAPVPGSHNAGDRVLNETNIAFEFDNQIAIALPVERNDFNPNRATSNSPVFSDLPFSLYFLDRIPVDLGIAWHFSNSTMEVQDVFQVTAGIEEWEILARFNSTGNRNASSLVLARTV